MSEYLVISAIGQDKPGIVNELSAVILNNQCNIDDSRMTVLGGEFALILLVSGNWNAISKLEELLPALALQSGMTIIAKRTEPRNIKNDRIPYLVEVISIDHPGIVSAIAEFFSTRNINIEDMNTSNYAAAHTGTKMFSVNMTISIPSSLHLGDLREQFTEFCDSLNLDAFMEPAKH
jgi:glycine cleavage system transcriptional repressor